MLELDTKQKKSKSLSQPLSVHDLGANVFMMCLLERPCVSKVDLSFLDSH